METPAIVYVGPYSLVYVWMLARDSGHNMAIRVLYTTGDWLCILITEQSQVIKNAHLAKLLIASP